MIRTITPHTLDELRYLLEHGSGSITVYFPLFSEARREADYVAKVAWDEAKIEYALGGHGIQSTQLHLPDRESVINRILADNKRFNDGNAFHVETPEAGSC